MSTHPLPLERRFLRYAAASLALWAGLVAAFTWYLPRWLEAEVLAGRLSSDADTPAIPLVGFAVLSAVAPAD